MALSQLDRGFLEKEIDDAIKNVKTTIDMARTEEYRKFIQITNESDFAFGWALGQIIRGFTLYFLTTHGRNLDASEYEETAERINTRAREIRDAIFKSG